MDGISFKAKIVQIPKGWLFSKAEWCKHIIYSTVSHINRVLMFVEIYATLKKKIYKRTLFLLNWNQWNT